MMVRKDLKVGDRFKYIYDHQPGNYTWVCDSKDWDKGPGFLGVKPCLPNQPVQVQK